MSDLSTRIRSYIEDRTDPVTFDEVVARSAPRRNRARRGRRVLVVATASIVAVSLTTAALLVIRDDRGSVPSISADGSSEDLAPGESLSIAAVKQKNGLLVILDAASGDVMRVLSENVTSVSSTPDGTAMYFARVRPDAECKQGVSVIMRVSVSGGDLKPVVAGANPIVSPDGRKLAFGSNTAGCGPSDSIQVLDIATGEVAGIPSLAGHGANDFQPLGWSASDPILLYRAQADGTGESRLYLARADGGVVSDFSGSRPWTSANYRSDRYPVPVVAESDGDGFRVVVLNGSSEPGDVLFRAPGTAPSTMSFDPSGNRLLYTTGGQDSNLFVWTDGDPSPRKIDEGITSAAWLLTNSRPSAPEPAPTTAVVVPTTGSPSTTPSTDPAGWTGLDYHGLRAAVPPGWEIVRSGCPGRDKTLTLGANARADENCPPSKPSASWIWLKPLPPDIGDDGRQCGPGSFNGIWGCQLRDSRALTETWYLDGLDIVLVFHGDSTVLSSWRYAGSAPPEAGGPDRSASAKPRLAEPAYVAGDFALAYLAGDCPAVSSLADETYDGGCPSPAPESGNHVVGGMASAPGGSIPTTAYRVSIDPIGHAYEVALQYVWSPETRRGDWKATRITEQ